MSPLLANIALAALDERLHEPWRPGGQMSTSALRARRRAKNLPNWRVVRYADDFVVLVHGDRADVDALQEDIAQVLAPMGLRLSPAKTRIGAIAADAWVEIKYPHPVWDDDQQRFVSRAQIAETTYTAFDTPARDAVTARLIVRRIPDLNKTAVDAQGELFPVWRYHAAFTDSPFVLVQAEEQHRSHAVIEQVFAELIDGPRPTCPRPVRRQQCLADLHRYRA